MDTFIFLVGLIVLGFEGSQQCFDLLLEMSLSVLGQCFTLKKRAVSQWELRTWVREEVEAEKTLTRVRDKQTHRSFEIKVFGNHKLSHFAICEFFLLEGPFESQLCVVDCHQNFKWCEVHGTNAL